MLKRSRARRYFVTGLLVAAAALGALALTAGSAVAQYYGSWSWGSPGYGNYWRDAWYGSGAYYPRGYGYGYRYGRYGGYYGRGYGYPYYGRYGYGWYGNRAYCNYWNNSYTSPCY